jgi:hypothetical protein
MIIRLHRRAREAEGAARLLFFEAAAEIGEVIPEDTGVDDAPHHELFAHFANFLVGDDRWQLDRYSVPGCERHRRELKEKRLSGDLEDAILLTAASENWNSGEFTYLEPMAKRWMTDVLGHSAQLATRGLAYVSHHSGKTELGHFLHVLKAWDLYCQAAGIVPDVGRARVALETNLAGVSAAFSSLENVLVQSAH